MVEINNATQQQIYGIWQIVLKMKIFAINKISRNLKMERFKMSNAAYSIRCSTFEK